MDFALDDEQQAVQELARQIFRREATNERHRDLEAGDVWFDDETWQAMGSVGLLGVAIPEVLGGIGLDFTSVALVLEELGATAAKIPYLGTQIGMGIVAVLDAAGIGVEWAPGVVGGQAMVAVALPQAGDDVHVTGGRAYGTVSLVDGGAWASHLVLVAPDESNTPAVFAIDAGESGVERIAQPTLLGAPQARFQFDDVHAARLGGSDAAERVRQLMVGGLCATAAGAARAALDLTASYARERVQFDRPIAGFQAVSQRAADMFIDVKAIRLTARQAAWRLGADVDATEAVAIAKFWASEGGRRVAFAAQHLHGGMGVDRDYPLFRFYSLLRNTELALGASPEHLRRLGTILATSPV
jgi:alkylation response protein AidB-like acyl-CoA dehydrogenase